MALLKDLLLSAPEGQIDQYLLDMIKQWDDEPTSLQILEVVDNAIYTAGTSDFTIRVLQIMLDSAMKNEGVTLEEIVPMATWRDRLI